MNMLRSAGPETYENLGRHPETGRELKTDYMVGYLL